MKIMFYINTLGIGGAERVIANLSEQFAEHGYEVILVTTFKASKEYCITEKVKRIFLEKNEFNGNYLFKNISRIISLRNIIISEKPDVVISFMIEANFRTVLGTIGLNTKSIVSVRNDPKREYKGITGKIVSRFILPFADGCVFQTEDAKKWFTYRLQNKSSIIYNPVNDVFFDTTSNSIRKNIVTTGRLVKQKNHELLIRAFANIANKIQDNLIIYGEGKERNNLENLINKLNMKDRIFLPGKVENVAEKIKSAKLYVLSSDFEGMPNGLMEAMALGLPCISTDCPCGGPRTIITNNENGILVEVGNIKQLSKSMLDLLNNNVKRIFFSKKAKIKADHFRLNIIFNNWEKYILAIMNKKL